MKKRVKKNRSVGPVQACQVCDNSRLTHVLSLGHQPILQKYLTKEELLEPETTYPLNLVSCPKCGLVQLDYVVDPSLVFMPAYPYRTGLTNMLVRNFRALAETLDADGYYAAGDLVVDIGSNDGTLLRQFKDRGAKVVGVEPTDVATIATRSGIPTLQHFFDATSVRQIRARHGAPRVITSTNVFAHINDANGLVKNIKALMDARTVFVSESQYWRDTVEKLAFDCVYDEHLRYYSLKPMIALFEKHGMSVIDAEHIDAAGGSIRVYARRGTHRMSARAKQLLAEEKQMKLHDKETLRAFADRVRKAKFDLVDLLISCKKKGARVAALTSAGRSNTLLGFTKIDHSLIEYAGEKKGSPKIGLYTPGTHIPVVDEAKILKEQPEYLLVLSWHIGDELMQKMRDAGYRGTFIVPLPSPRLVPNA